MLMSYWTPVLTNGARRELEQAFNRVYPRQQPAVGQFPLTAWEDEQQVYLEVDVPGFGSESIDIRFKDGQLWIQGERPVPQQQGNPRHNERMFGAVRRIVTLPETVDPASIEAELNDGVLSITVRKQPESQPLKIEVKSGDGQSKRIDN